MTATVSVVVPVYNGERTIAHAVRAILEQDYPRDKYEAILVDNASTDRTPAILASFGPRVRTVREAKRGASAARNAGIREARHACIAFTDADCIADPSWLRELVHAATAGPAADFVGGRILAYAPRSPVETFAEALMNQEWAMRVSRPPGAVTANLMVRRELLFAIGLFDESLRRGQDVDLAYRAHFQRRATFVYAERAVVRHVNPATLPALFVKGVQHGLAAAAVLRKHARALSKTPYQRCLDWRRYAAILREGGRVIRCGYWSYVNGDVDAEEARVRSLCRAVFESGKQLGVLLGTVRGLVPQRQERMDSACL